MADGALNQSIAELSPTARAMLLAAFERRIAAGETELATSTVLQHLRAQTPSLPEAARLFFQPLGPFLIEDTRRRHPGRLAREAIPQLWAWLSGELMPEAVAAYVCEANEALQCGEFGAADALARALQDRAVAAIRAAFAEAEDDETGPSSLSPESEADVHALRWVLRGRDVLARLDAALPECMDDLTHDDCEALIALLETASRPRELFPYALAIVTNRLRKPWLIARVAAQAVESRSASRISDTAYGVVVAMLVAQAERLLDALSAVVAAGDHAGSARLLKSIDAMLRGLRSEIEIPLASSLGRHLDALSAEAAAFGQAALAAVQPVKAALTA